MSIGAVLDRLSRLHPKVIDLSLGRVRHLLDRLGNPERHLPPVIHVAGTNGKGSTVATMRAIAEAMGLRVHVYTSPHLVRFAERIRVAGSLMDDAPLIALLEEVEAVNGSDPITFFEITNAAAFLIFARVPADLCILETGLGGLLDSTNVVDAPAATVITPIGLDHQQFLGATLAEIAVAKAGIIKAGSPCISAAQPKEAMAVIADRATRLSAPLLVEGRHFRVEDEDDDSGHWIFQGAQARWSLPLPNLPGEFQRHNAGLALATLERLYPDLSIEAVTKGLAQVDWPARLQRLRKGPLIDRLPPGWEIWLDGTHNPHGAAAVAEFLKQWSDRPVFGVMGMLTTKDIDGIFEHLAPRLAAMRGVPIEGEHLTHSAQAVADKARAHGIKDAAACHDVAQAVDALVAASPGPARILICGSLYLAGTVLAENG